MKSNGRVVVVEPLPSRLGRKKGSDKFTLRYSVDLTPELVEECRDCVDFLSGRPLRMTLVKFVGQALTAHLRLLEKRHNGGNRFERRGAPLKHARRTH